MADNKKRKSSSFKDILSSLLSSPTSLSLLPSQSPNPHFPALTAQIADLQLHPTLEAALHIINGDLSGAHFLVRHMQNEPAFEGMILHAILHRVEGDYGNARAWYKNVETSEVFSDVWGVGRNRENEACLFVDRVQELKKSRHKYESNLNGSISEETTEWKAEESALEKRSRQEILAALKWCEKRFGTGKWTDASTEWVKSSDDHQEMKERMIVAGEGWRQF